MSLRRSRIAATAAMVAVGMLSTPGALADEGGDARSSYASDVDNAYVLSDNYIYEGKVYGPEDGVEVHTGAITVSDRGPESGQRQRPAAANVTRWGTSFASNEERKQLWYDGIAYASGKRDYRVPVTTGYKYKRVVEVCFKYTRGGKDLIGWQCSKASLGPLFTPGAKIKKTVRDTLNPFAPKTVFRYSFKAI